MTTKKMKCRWCGYEWESKSQMIWTTCPSCQLKTKPKEEKDGNNEKDGEEDHPIEKLS